MRLLILWLAFFPVLLPGQNMLNTNSDCELFYDSSIHRSYYKYAEEAPSYIGGADSLNKTLRKHIRLPQIDRHQFEGTVWVSFIVETDGSISNIRLLKKVAVPYYNEEALRATAFLKSWNPGKCNGLAVPVLQYLPVRFGMQ